MSNNHKPELSSWLNNKASSHWHIYIKRLSGNDTGITGSHQAGFYIPQNMMEALFPDMARDDIRNPDQLLTAKTFSHEVEERQVRAIYYNNHVIGGSRNESRITSWGGKTGDSPLQDFDNTGSLAIFAFCATGKSRNVDEIELWVTRSVEEEEQLEVLLGEVAPGETVFGRGDQVLSGFAFVDTDGASSKYDFPEEWRVLFPTGAEIIQHLTDNIPLHAGSPDKLLMKRREIEFSLFRKIEEAHVLGKIKQGFDSVQTFIDLANSVSNRRKSRSGRSLEIHLEQIFRAEGLTQFEGQCVTENRKKPDFIFPSCGSYHNLEYPSKKLRMLAVKTTCKDRWRQILNEANRIEKIHLFTLQEGVSEPQFREMQSSNVTLVVPQPLHNKYPKAIRSDLMSLDFFIKETKSLY